MSFNIKATSKNEKYAEADLTIGEYRDKLYIPTHYWSLEDYREQWKDGINRLRNKDRSAIIVENYGPVPKGSTKQDNCVGFARFCMYRFGDEVYITSSFLDQSIFAESLDYHEWYDYIDDYQKENDMDWYQKTSYEDLVKWRNSL